jgi:ABC-type dipeptide/oligopeptide/nickel transport system ATPase subunit
MQNYHVKLTSPVSDTFRCSMAANSLDIDVNKKSVHEFSIDADLKTDWNVGLIVGASGSGKTTLANEVFGKDCFDFDIDESKPIIDQFPKDWTYEQCQNALNGIGLSQVPCWIRPVATLSNGQKARAIAALQLSRHEDFVVDEWTSVVDRTVAKSMSVCLAKHARKIDKKITAVSCHYDVIEWLNPDWIIDCNKGIYIDRRCLWRNYQREEKLHFNIRVIGRESWKYFSKYHYLSEKLPGGIIKLFGLFHGDNQIGFQCFANYTPKRKTDKKMKMHSNRTVIHPDYVGLGLGMKLIEETSKIMADNEFDVWAKFSSVPVAKSFEKSNNWKLCDVQRFQAPAGGTMQRTSGFRQAIKTYSYHYEPKL